MGGVWAERGGDREGVESGRSVGREGWRQRGGGEWAECGQRGVETESRSRVNSVSKNK